MIKRVFRLSLRAAQGFIDSIFDLMGVPLRCPDYTSVSKRAMSVNVGFKTPSALKKRKVFPTDDSMRKVIYLAIQSASKKWSMPIQNWRLAMSRFIIEFGDRLDGHY